MLIGEPLGGRCSSSVRSSDEVNDKSIMSKEGLIISIFGSDYRVPVL